MGSSKEIRMFEKVFGLRMPEETNIIFSEEYYGAMGDGDRLYIYQLSSKGMEQFTEQRMLAGWYDLPFSEIVSEELWEKIKGAVTKYIFSHSICNLGEGSAVCFKQYAAKPCPCLCLLIQSLF